MFGLQPGLSLRHYGLGQRYEEALDLIESTWARSGLPPTIGAFSLAATPDGSSRAVSLFASAGVLFGSDANIRRTLLKLGRKREWNLGLYEAVSASIEGHKGPSTRHGIIAWIVSNRGPVELRIGLRPAKGLNADVVLNGETASNCRVAVSLPVPSHEQSGNDRAATESCGHFGVFNPRNATPTVLALAFALLLTQWSQNGKLTMRPPMVQSGM